MVIGRDSSIRILVDSLASKRHANFEIISLATGLTILAFLACLAKHGGSHWCFQFFLHS